MTCRRFSGLGVALASLLCVSLPASAAAPSASPPAPVTPPPLPALKSPVDFFRELLALSASERKQSLTNRPPEIRERLLAKAREYERMPPDLRELRLRATELRWYLVPLMKTPAARRPRLSDMVPAHLLKPVEDRLVQWDLLPPDAQPELLENELALDYFTQAQVPDPAQLGHLPAAQRQKLEADIARWKAMPEGEQARLVERVKKFFDLTPREQEKALKTLSPTEREQMEKTLSAFEKLPREQRIQCIRSFGKLANLGAAERMQFLQNAERWSTMSLAERESWRNLVRRLPDIPPLPPGFASAPPPPLPPEPARRSPAVATNGS